MNLLPAIRSVSHRGSIRSLPRRFTAPSLPTAILRRLITIQAPSLDPSSSQSDRGYELVSDGYSASSNFKSSSQHPFASVNPAPSSSTTLPPPPETLPIGTPPHHLHPFDTHAFVTYLEKAEISYGTSRALMEGVREIIVNRGERTRKEMVGREDMENGAYLFKAALSELRTELSVRARNDGLVLRTNAGLIRREVEGLEQKLKEDIGTLKHDIEMDMNNRKSETRTEIKAFDIGIEEINNKFTISLGDLRTEIESVKWDATRRAISVIAVIVVVSIGMSSAMRATAKASPKKAVAASPAAQPAMRDMAVGDDESLDSIIGVGAVESELDKLLRESGVEKLRQGDVHPEYISKGSSHEEYPQRI
ncbi:hypothetical protein P7C73_g5686, partial [Tremellales sp. Uapishka_1]